MAPAPRQAQGHESHQRAHAQKEGGGATSGRDVGEGMAGEGLASDHGEYADGCADHGDDRARPWRRPGPARSRRIPGGNTAWRMLMVAQCPGAPGVAPASPTWLSDGLVLAVLAHHLATISPYGVSSPTDTSTRPCAWNTSTCRPYRALSTSLRTTSSVRPADGSAAGQVDDPVHHRQQRVDVMGGQQDGDVLFLGYPSEQATPSPECSVGRGWPRARRAAAIGGGGRGRGR